MQTLTLTKTKLCAPLNVSSLNPSDVSVGSVHTKQNSSFKWTPLVDDEIGVSFVLGQSIPNKTLASNRPH
jgi:hypothetical protein